MRTAIVIMKSRNSIYMDTKTVPVKYLPHRFMRGDVKFLYYGEIINRKILKEVIKVCKSPWQGVEEESQAMIVPVH